MSSFSTDNYGAAGVKSVDEEMNGFFYIPTMMPLQSGSSYAPFEVDENGNAHIASSFTGVVAGVASYSHGAVPLASKGTSVGESMDWQSHFGRSSPLNFDEDLIVDGATDKSSDFGMDVEFVAPSSSTQSVDSCGHSSGLVQHSCFYTLAGFARQYFD